MSTIWVLFKNNLKASIQKKKGAFILMIVFPVIILMIASKVLNFSQGFINIGIIDEDNSKASSALIKNIKNTDGITLKNLKREDIDNNFSEKSIVAAIVIPKNFSNNLLELRDSGVIVKHVEGESTVNLIKGVLGTELKNVEDLAKISNKNEQLYNELLDKYSSGTVKIEKSPLSDLSKGYGVTQIFIGFLMMFMFMKATQGAFLVTKDKSSKMYTRIFVGPVKTYQYYLANILSNIVTLLIQISAALLALKYITKTPMGMKYSDLFIILFMIAIVAISIGTFCIAVTNKEEEANMISTFIMMALLMVGGCFVPVRFFPSFINKISYFTPTRWAVDAMQDLQQGMSLSYVTKNLAIMMLFAIAFFVIAAYKTSRTEKI